MSYTINRNILQGWQTAHSHPEELALPATPAIFILKLHMWILIKQKKPNTWKMQERECILLNLIVFICGNTFLRITYVTLVLSKEGILRKHSKTALYPALRSCPKWQIHVNWQIICLTDYQKKPNILPCNTSSIILDSQINIFYHICQDKTQQCCFKQDRSILSSNSFLQQIIFL